MAIDSIEALKREIKELEDQFEPRKRALTESIRLEAGKKYPCHTGDEICE
jgi:hypothetical protein